MSLIQCQIHQPVINFQTRLKKMCGSFFFISIEKILTHLKACLINSTTIKIHVENPSSRSVYTEGRSTRGQILNRFSPYFIKSDLWFHILKFISQINLSPKEHWLIFKGSSEIIPEISFICEIWKEQKCNPSFGSHTNEIPPWSEKIPPLTHCSKY